MKNAQMSFVLVFSSLLAGGVFAQEPSAEPEAFTDRVEVEVVNVDVIVTEGGDRNGRRVLDLSQDDFEILVDGRPVAIEYFSPPRLGPAQPAAPLDPTTTMATAQPAPPPVAATSPTNLVFYIDQTALENRTRHITVAELHEFLRSRPEGSDRVMVAAFEQRLDVLLLPTTDRSRIEQALEEIEATPSLGGLGPGERLQIEQEIRAYGRNAMRLSGASAGIRSAALRMSEAQRLEHDIVVWAEQQIERQRRSIAALRQLVSALAAVEGRKAVVLATAGIQGNPARGLFAALDQQRGVSTPSDINRAPTLELQAQSLLLEFEQVIQAAQNARIAFYTVSPGVAPPPENNAEFASAGPYADRPLPRDYGLVEASSSVARLAGATGGAVLTIGNDLDGRLVAVTADVDAAYSLGFTTGADAGEKDHRIDVRTRRAGLEVRHRESFRRRTAPDRAEAGLAAAVTFGQADNPMEITLKVGEGTTAGKKPAGQVVPIAVGIPLRFLALLPDGSERHGRFSVRLAVQDPRGRVLESSAAVVPIVVPEEQMARAMESSWYHRAEMRLAPGEQRLAVVVLDEISGLQSTAFVELAIPGKI